MNTYIATVEYFDEFRDELAKDTVLMRATSYSEAVGQIEQSFDSTIENILSITALSDMAVIHLGDSPELDKFIDIIMQENSY